MRNTIVDVNGNPLFSATNPAIVQQSASNLSGVTTLQNAANAIGVGTPLSTNGYGVASLAISGTFVATITFEGQAADGNWYTISAMLRGSGSIATTTTTTGLYEINTRGLTAVRANITTFTSGTVTVKGQAQPLSTGGEFVSLTGSKAIVDGASAPIIPQMLYDGSVYNLQRGNTDGILLPSAARTADTVSPTQTNFNARGIIVYLNITAASGTGGLKVVIRGIDPGGSGSIAALNPVPTAILATGLYAYEVSPGASGGGVAGAYQVNQSTSGSVPKRFNVALLHTDATSYTYSLSYALI